MEMIRIDPPPELDMPIGEAMFTQRAIRRLDPKRPIADAHLKIILDAASKAPSGGNTQPARFLVEFHCCIPLGYPRGKFGPTRRFPTSETTSWNRWNAKAPWA